MPGVVAREQGWSQHAQAVDRLRASYDAIPADQKVRLAKRTSNLFRARMDGKRTGLDVSGLNGVIEVDPSGSTADVTESYDSLVTQYSLAVTAHEQILKSFNTSLLLSTRSDDLRVKRQSLSTLDVVWDALGDAMLTFVPETTPFLSETLDETEGGVDRAARKLIKRIEDHLGESLDSYLEA